MPKWQLWTLAWKGKIEAASFFCHLKNYTGSVIMNECNSNPPKSNDWSTDKRCIRQSESIRNQIGSKSFLKKNV